MRRIIFAQIQLGIYLCEKSIENEIYFDGHTTYIDCIYNFCFELPDEKSY